MQKDKSTTPTMKRTQNFTRPRTPDRNDAATRARSRGQMRPRTITASTDLPLPGVSLARRSQLINTGRMSIIPSNQFDVSRRLETEITSNELGLLYDKYVQSLAEEAILKRKIDDREKTMITQLTALGKDLEQLDERLQNIQMKEYDVSILDEIQRILDIQVKEITTLLRTYQGKPVEILMDIQSMLRSLDRLTCKDITIPKTKQDMAKLLECLYGCNELLISMNLSIEARAESLNIGRHDLKHFVQIHENIEKQILILENAIEYLQLDLLKRVSATLPSSYNQTIAIPM